MLKRETLQFLEELKFHNNREWMKQNVVAYDYAVGDFKKFVAQLIERIDDFDHHLEGLEAEDSVFSIERNSSEENDNPYKTHFGAYISFGGKLSEYAGYYLHVAPGDTYLGGGMYKPVAAVIRKIRQEIDYAPSQIKRVVNAPDFKEFFGSLQGDKLPNVPEGYSRDHEQIELLKLTSFFAIHHFSAEVLCTEQGIQYCAERYNTLHPLTRFLNETFVSQ